MRLQGAYEKNGWVFLEDDNHGISRMTWKEAMLRANAVRKSELVVSIGKRTLGIQRVIEQMIKAAVAARKKDDPDWKVSRAVSMFTKSCKTSQHAPVQYVVPSDS